MKKPRTATPASSVVEKWHLGRHADDILLTEFELVMLRFQQAFERWALHVMARCGDQTMSFAEIVLIHAVRLQEQPSSAQSVARILNRDDIPNVQYSLRKLVKRGYLEHTHGSSKNYTFAATDLGRRITDDYAEVRHTILVAHTLSLEVIRNQMQAIVNGVGMLTGQYDEAMRKLATHHFSSIDGPKAE